MAPVSCQSVTRRSSRGQRRRVVRESLSRTAAGGDRADLADYRETSVWSLDCRLWERVQRELDGRLLALLRIKF